MDILVLTAGAWPLNQKDDAGPDTNKVQIPSVVRSQQAVAKVHTSYNRLCSLKTTLHHLKTFTAINTAEGVCYGSGT